MVMSREEHSGNGEKRLGSWIYRSVHLLVNVAALMLMGYAGLWLRNNVPSKADFKELQLQVNSMDRSFLQFAETHKRIDDFEQRIRRLEQGDRRPPPPRREP